VGDCFVASDERPARESRRGRTSQRGRNRAARRSTIRAARRGRCRRRSTSDDAPARSGPAPPRRKDNASAACRPARHRGRRV